MPDETRGVPVYRSAAGHWQGPGMLGFLDQLDPFHAYPVDEAAAMEDVIAAGRVCRSASTFDDRDIAYAMLDDATDRLDTIRRSV